MSAEIVTLVGIVMLVEIDQIVVIVAVEKDLPARIDTAVIKETVESVMRVENGTEKVEVVVIVMIYEITEIAKELENVQEVLEDLVALLGLD